MVFVEDPHTPGGRNTRAEENIVVEDVVLSMTKCHGPTDLFKSVVSNCVEGGLYADNFGLCVHPVEIVALDQNLGWNIPLSVCSHSDRLESIAEMILSLVVTEELVVQDPGVVACLAVLVNPESDEDPTVVFRRRSFVAEPAPLHRVPLSSYLDPPTQEEGLIW